MVTRPAVQSAKAVTELQPYPHPKSANKRPATVHACRIRINYKQVGAHEQEESTKPLSSGPIAPSEGSFSATKATFLGECDEEKRGTSQQGTFFSSAGQSNTCLQEANHETYAKIRSDQGEREIPRRGRGQPGATRTLQFRVANVESVIQSWLREDQQES